MSQDMKSPSKERKEKHKTKNENPEEKEKEVNLWARYAKKRPGYDRRHSFSQKELEEKKNKQYRRERSNSESEEKDRHRRSDKQKRDRDRDRDDDKQRSRNRGNSSSSPLKHARRKSTAEKTSTRLSKTEKRRSQSSKKEIQFNVVLFNQLFSDDNRQIEDIEKTITNRFTTEEEIVKFRKGITRVQACIRSRQTRKWLAFGSKNVIYRENVAKEIFKTELDYVNNLATLVEVYLEPLQKLLDSKPRDQQLVWFCSLISNVNIIRNYNSTLASELRPIIENWNEDQLLGEFFCKAANFLQLYTQYVSKHSDATTELTEFSKKTPDVANFLHNLSQSEEAKFQTIYAFLIQPIQRIPRYGLLVQDLIKHTSPLHPDYEPLQKSHVALCNIAAAVNTKTLEADQKKKVLQIQNRLNQLTSHSDTLPSLVSPTRRFISERTMQVWSIYSQKFVNRTVILFNDFLLETKPIKTNERDDCLEFKRQLHLTRLTPVTFNEHGQVGLSLVDYGTESVIMKFILDSIENRDKLLKEIEELKDEMERNRQTHEDLVLERAKQRAEKAKEQFITRYGATSQAESGATGNKLGGSSTAPLASLGGGGWEARLQAMRDRAEARKLQKQSTGNSFATVSGVRGKEMVEMLASGSALFGEGGTKSEEIVGEVEPIAAVDKKKKRKSLKLNFGTWSRNSVNSGRKKRTSVSEVLSSPPPERPEAPSKSAIYINRSKDEKPIGVLVLPKDDSKKKYPLLGNNPIQTKEKNKA